MDLTNIIERIIKIRINNILEKSEIDEKTQIDIKEINNDIVKDNKQKQKDIKKSKVEKKNRNLIGYNVYIKDANNILNNNPTLNYLSPKFITQINKIKNENNGRVRMTELSKIWKNLDNNCINKYNNLTKDKNFTNEKYDNLINKYEKKK